MTALRKLGGSYVAVASAGVIVLALAQHGASTSDLSHWPRPRLEFRWIPQTAPPGPAPSAAVASAAHPESGKAGNRGSRLSLVTAPEKLRRLVPPPLPRERLAPMVSAAQRSAPETRRAELRLKDDLTRELYDNFKLFVYVSKAESGPLAQHMYVFEKRQSGALSLLYDWPVSTGREQIETDFTGATAPTHTPTGYYELDPKRFFRDHVSAEWREPMPYAMFLNWIKDGSRTGLAIHAATGDGTAQLGTRASAGCIRLAPEDARTLFNLIRDGYRGPVPRFAVDSRSGTMSTSGAVQRDARGGVKFAEGYKVLVVIENYGGSGVKTVAAMY